MAIGPMTREEAEEEDLIIITEERALLIIEEDLKEELTRNIWNSISLTNLIWDGFKGLSEWKYDDITHYFEGSEMYIPEWEITADKVFLGHQ